MHHKALDSEVKDASTIIVGGYGALGAPSTLINSITKSGAKDLHIVTASAGIMDKGIFPLLEAKKVAKLTTSDISGCPLAQDLYEKGELEIEMVPLGLLAEKIRSGGLGLPAFCTTIGAQSPIEYGGIPMKIKNGEVVKTS